MRIDQHLLPPPPPPPTDHILSVAPTSKCSRSFNSMKNVCQPEEEERKKREKLRENVAFMIYSQHSDVSTAWTKIKIVPVN